jgi:hypothetical protein
MDPEHDGQALLGRFFRRVDIQDVALVTVLHVRNVRSQLLSDSAARKQEKRQNAGENELGLHGVDSF